MAGSRTIVVPAGFTKEVYDRAVIRGADGSRRVGDLVGPTAVELPVSVDFLGRAFSEPVLIRIAAAYEQATRHRRPPKAFTLGSATGRCTMRHGLFRDCRRSRCCWLQAARRPASPRSGSTPSSRSSTAMLRRRSVRMSASRGSPRASSIRPRARMPASSTSTRRRATAAVWSSTRSISSSCARPIRRRVRHPLLRGAQPRQQAARHAAARVTTGGAVRSPMRSTIRRRPRMSATALCSSAATRWCGRPGTRMCRARMRA